MGLQLAFKTRERHTRAKSLEKLVALYDGGILPQDDMTVEAFLTSYQTGKVPFVSVLEAMTALYADRWARAGLGGGPRAAARQPARSEPGRRAGDVAGLGAGGRKPRRAAGGMAGGMSGK